ncbi:hypothetical protein GWK91_13755 [Virgibacillus sp. MSP4-1]|nr:hypothetical protein GWK91_13755 [Virgibacillus sp. MSP4-1]
MLKFLCSLCLEYEDFIKLKISGRGKVP